MSAAEEAIAPAMALTVTERARTALAGIKTEDELKALAVNSVSITGITNTDGYEQCHAARMVLKNTRLAITKRGEAAREDAVAFSKAALTEQKRLVAFIEPEEKRLQTIEDAWDAAIEAEKERKIEAERKRVSDLQDCVAELRGCPMLSAQSASTLVAEHIADLDALAVDETFQEFQEQAVEAKAAGLARLREIHTAALAREAAEAKAQADREELDRLREESARREAADAARRAEEARVAKEQREADERAAAERQADLDRQSAEIEAKAREQQEITAAEQRRLEADREALDTREAALAAPAIEIRREPVEAPIRSLTPPEASKPRAGAPSRDEIISVLAEHYKVPTEIVAYWLGAITWERAA